MEEEQKSSPVALVQKLIAIHTTRKEASEKMAKHTSLQLQSRLKSVLSQSDKFTNMLLNELSQFGDAVQSEVDRKDEYQQLWNKETNNIETMDEPALSQTFEKSEKSLINIYQQIIDTNHDLPVSLNDLLISQVNELKQTV